MKVPLIQRVVAHGAHDGCETAWVEQYWEVECPNCKQPHILTPEEYRDRYVCWLIPCEYCIGDISLDLPVESLGSTDENLEWALELFRGLEGRWGFPTREIALIASACEFLKMVSTRERGEWLFGELMKLERYPTPIVMRRIYQRRYTPADHVEEKDLISSRFDVERKEKHES